MTFKIAIFKMFCIHSTFSTIEPLNAIESWSTMYGHIPSHCTTEHLAPDQAASLMMSESEENKKTEFAANNNHLHQLELINLHSMVYFD